MKPSNLFKPSKYINKIRSIKESIKKSQRIIELINSNFLSTPLSNIWEIGSNSTKTEEYSNISEYKIFGTPINLNTINWQKDYVYGFEYPIKRFDKIKISKWFDKGIDVKFPWEVSRFYFVIKLAQNYVITKDEKYYGKFKELVFNWIDKNPFCYGVNWGCTMEAAIRAINWIVAVNIFDNIFHNDAEFKNTLLKSLVQHAEYISTFPEIYNFNHKKHISNHTTADYTGLLFLVLTLKEHPNSEKWLEQALEGLEECIRYQTYEDGVNFEASIPYHRLVLEMFAYSAIVAKANDIEFSNKYYELLFKMFEYSAAYMDHIGNAPQVGDNDSGRILIFHKSDEHDHSYLLDLGEHIFDYKFKSQCKKRNPEFRQWLPEIEKINVDELSVKPRETYKSIAFEKGGAYFVKNDNFSLMVACLPIGQNGRGGHNHYDMGSFTLSYKGQPIIVDPGSYTYTRIYKNRKLLKSLEYHNTVIFKNNIRYDKDGFRVWNTEKIFICSINKFRENTIEYQIQKLRTKKMVTRNIKISDYSIVISEQSDVKFTSVFHLSPYIKMDKIDNIIQIVNLLNIKILESKKISIEPYFFSNNYDSIIKSNCIKIEPIHKKNITIILAK